MDQIDEEERILPAERKIIKTGILDAVLTGP